MNGIFLGTNAVYRSIRPSVRNRFCISIMSKMSKSYLKCNSRICHREAHPTLVKRGRAGPGRAGPGRACVKTFLFPVKSRRSLADFNAESVVCCLAQRVIWQFWCIIIKIWCCLLCFVAGAMSVCEEIRETYVPLLSLNILFESCKRLGVWVCDPEFASRDLRPTAQDNGRTT